MTFKNAAPIATEYPWARSETGTAQRRHAPASCKPEQGGLICIACDVELERVYGIGWDHKPMPMSWNGAQREAYLAGRAQRIISDTEEAWAIHDGLISMEG